MLKNVWYVIFFLVFASCSNNRLKDGKWRGVFHIQEYNDSVNLLFCNSNIPSSEIPFIFEVSSAKTDNTVVTLINGEDSFRLTDITYRNDSVIIPIKIYDATLEAKIKGDQMSGRLVKHYSNRPDDRVPFTAQKGVLPRFNNTNEKATVSLDGFWEITVPDKNNEKQVGIFTQKPNGYLTGSILTSTGDYRFLEGVVQAKCFYLSAFAGLTPYLIRGQFSGKDSFKAEFITPSKKTFFEGIRNPNAALPNVYDMTTLKPGCSTLDFCLPTFDGRKISLSDPKYKGKVVIVTLLGSWCPNCLDEAAFLAPWYKANRTKGVEVIGIAFERKNDIEYAKNQLGVFMEKFDITYDILFAGKADNETIAKVLPELTELRSYPTTFLIDKKGQVRKIHTGFSGPATGKFYDDFKIEFNRNVNELIAEK